MALFNCPNCGAIISDTANHCPKCGVKLKNNSTKEKNKTSLYALLAVLGVLVLIVVGTILYSDFSEKQAEKKAKMEAEQAKSAAIRERDSLDNDLWEKTLKRDNEEAYRTYLKKFPEGIHVDQAQQRVVYEEKLKLTENEEYSVVDVISRYFNNLANNYEEDMLECLNQSLTYFLGKKNATKVDAIAYMKKIHSDDVFSVQIAMGDIDVKKTLVDDDEPVFTAEFTYDQRLEREDTSQETFASMKGTATLNSNFKITSLSLSKAASY